MGMATTIGLRGISLSSYSLPFLRTWKTKPSYPTVFSATSRTSLKPLFLPCNNGVILKRCRSFCVSPNVNTEAAAPSVKETDENDREPPSSINIKDAAHLLDIRVGRIIKAWRHEEADSLYVEEVDVGEPEPRIICSGLVKYIPLELLQDAKVVVLANLKPRNMRGVKSSGMLMAASDVSHENVELLLPPDEAIPGDRIWFGTDEDKDNLPDPATPNQVQKKKIWESVQPHIKTDASCTATIGEHFMRTSAGVVVCKSLKNANVS